MREITSDRLTGWTRGAGLLGLVMLGWAVLVPGGLFWTALPALGLIGVTLATTALVRNRSIPTLAQVIAHAEAEAPGARRTEHADEPPR